MESNAHDRVAVLACDKAKPLLRTTHSKHQCVLMKPSHPLIRMSSDSFQRRPNPLQGAGPLLPSLWPVPYCNISPWPLAADTSFAAEPARTH